MTYRIADVEAAKAQIKAALPDTEFEETDYGFGLRAHRGVKGCIVFQPERLSEFQHERTTPPELVIELLR